MIMKIFFIFYNIYWVYILHQECETTGNFVACDISSLLTISLADMGFLE